MINSWVLLGTAILIFTVIFGFIGGSICIILGFLVGGLLLLGGLIVPNKKTEYQQTKNLSGLGIRGAMQDFKERNKQQPVVKSYVDSKDEAFEILRTRYAKGEITKEQFEQMRTDLEK